MTTSTGGTGEAGALCAACGKGQSFRRGWCEPCHKRWACAGRPTDGPPPRRYHRNKGTTCTVDGCEQPAAFRTWCGACYTRWFRQGKPDAGPPSRAVTPTTLREDLAWLREQGESLETAARRIGVSVRAAAEWDKQRGRVSA